MKKGLLFGGGTLGVVVLAFGAVFALAYFRGIGTAPAAEDVPGAEAYVHPTATPLDVLPAPTAPASPVSGTPVPGATQRPSATATPRPVAFQLSIEQTHPPESSVLLSAEVTVHLKATLVNRGDFDAHNVRVTARARVGSDYVAIDGKQALVVPVGAVPARSSTARDLTFTLEMSLSQGRTAQAQGLLFEVVASSDEATSYMPVMRCTASGCSQA
jgi:hypothetical protein